MIRPGQQAHQMRHHQPDKHDHARRRYRRAHTQCSAEHQFTLEPFHINPKVIGFGLTQ